MNNRYLNELEKLASEPNSEMEKSAAVEVLVHQGISFDDAVELVKIAEKYPEDEHPRDDFFEDSRLAAAATGGAIGLGTTALAGLRFGPLAAAAAGIGAGSLAAKLMSVSSKKYNAELEHKLSTDPKYRKAFLDKAPGFYDNMSDSHAALNRAMIEKIKNSYGN